MKLKINKCGLYPMTATDLWGVKLEGRNTEATAVDRRNRCENVASRRRGSASLAKAPFANKCPRNALRPWD